MGTEDKKKVFNYVVVASDDIKDKGQILAKDEQDALIRVAAKNSIYADDGMEVLIRPF